MPEQIECTFQCQCELCICKNCIKDCMQCQKDEVLPRSNECVYMGDETECMK